MRALLPLALGLIVALFGAVTAPPAQAREARFFIFGNSLVHYLDGGPETNVPLWLDRMARARGDRVAVDGRWGFLRDFARDLPPEKGWSIRGVAPALGRGQSLAQARLDGIIIAPANFIQHAPPDTPYWDEPAGGTSPLSALLALIDWLSANSPGTPIFIYEGWADMAPFSKSFPPGRRALARYARANTGAYHQWYLDLVEMARKARPEADIRLVPVALRLGQAMADGPLSGLPAEALFVDNAPHGTPALYLLAAMAAWPELMGGPVPLPEDLPRGIDPYLANALPKLAQFFSAGQAGAAGAGRAPPQPSAPAATPARAPRPAPEPALTPTPDTGLANPALAMGLNGIFDWSSEQPFIDVMKTARPWIGHTAETWGAFDDDALRAAGHLNAQGWPVSLPEGATMLESFILTDLPPEATSLAGRYRVSWRGTGTLRLGGRARGVSINEAGHEAWFAFTPGDGPVAIRVLATNAQDPIRDITVVPARFIPLWQAGARFNPDWLAVVRDLRAVRFMDWMMTNGSPITTWQDRPRLTDATWAWRGVPAEVMIELANEIGADPWFCMPHAADDGYVRAFAAMVRERLDKRLVANVEYSNEVWNRIFPQAGWLADQARARWGGRAGEDAGLQFAGMRAAQVGAIWAEVFGPEAPRRLQRIIAVHTGWPGLEEAMIEAPLWRAEDPAAPPPEAAFDAYAVSGYFGYELGGDEMAGAIRRLARAGEAGLDEAARLIREGSLSELIDELYPQHAAAARRLGYEMLMYEGGTHVVAHGAQAEDTEIVAFFTRLNYSPQMAALYETLIEGFRAAGGTLFNAFVDVAAPSRHGSWGAQRWLGDKNPRWQVLARYNRTGPAGWEARAPATFLHGVLRLGTTGADVLTGTEKADTLIAGPGDDVLVGNGGPDHLNGGEGVDLAILPGTPQEVRFTRDGPRLRAHAPGGPANVITLFSVELIQFAAAPGSILETEGLGH